MRESNERVISIPNVSKRVFLLLLEYIYVDAVKIDVEHAVELYICADLYRMERLREMCCTVVRRNLSACAKAVRCCIGTDAGKVTWPNSPPFSRRFLRA